LKTKQIEAEAKIKEADVLAEAVRFENAKLKEANQTLKVQKDKFEEIKEDFKMIKIDIQKDLDAAIPIIE
jgi:hypothetical protein